MVEKVFEFLFSADSTYNEQLCKKNIAIQKSNGIS